MEFGGPIVVGTFMTDLLNELFGSGIRACVYIGVGDRDCVRHRSSGLGHWLNCAIECVWDVVECMVGGMILVFWCSECVRVCSSANDGASDGVVRG